MAPYTAAVLESLKSPELERLLRSGPPRELRAFSVACGQLAVRMTEYDQPAGITPLLRRYLDMAGLLAQDVPADDPDIAQARAEARATFEQLDVAQLNLLGLIEEETYALSPQPSTTEHPRYAAYTLACRGSCAAEIVAQTLNEDAFEGAVECAYILHGLRIDVPTILAIARANISPAAK